jgi:hypothetical protein
VKSVDKYSIHIVLIADEFILDILQHGNEAWKGKKLSGSINNI